MSEFQVGDKIREIKNPDSVGHVYELHPTEKKFRVKWLPDGFIGRRFADAEKFEPVPSEVETLQAEITSLQQANTELLQAMEAQSEKLGKLKQGMEAMHQICNIPPSNLVMSTQHPQIIREMLAAIEETYKRYMQAETNPEPASGGFAGYVAKIKKLLTKNNEVMAIMVINGNECIAFPRTWQEYGKVLESGKELQIVYKEDNSKGYPQFIIESAGFLYESEDVTAGSEAE